MMTKVLWNSPRLYRVCGQVQCALTSRRSSMGTASAPATRFDKLRRVFCNNLPSVTLPKQRPLGLTEYIFLRNADKLSSEKMALVDAVTGDQVTYGELKERVAALAGGLTDLGITKGSFVLLLSPNSIELVVIVLASLALGAVVLTANYTYPGEELEKQFSDVDISLLFSTVEIVSRLRSGSVFLSSLKTVLIDREEGTRSHADLLLSDLFASRRVPVRPVPVPEVTQDDPALVMFSSGPMGLSKRVVFTHRNLIACVTAYCDNPLSEDSSDDVEICVIPQFQLYGLVVLTFTCLLRRNTVVILPKYTNGGELLEVVHKYHVTILDASPGILMQIMNKNGAIFRAHESELGCLKKMRTAGVPMDRDIIMKWVQFAPQLKVLPGYGRCAETTAMGATFPASDYDPAKNFHAGTAGTLTMNTQGKILQQTSYQFLPTSMLGELYLRNTDAMAAYFKDPVATAKAVDEEGWFNTRDIAWFSEQGYVYVREINSDKHSKFTAASMQLEEVLRKHPKIQNAVVIFYSNEIEVEIYPIAFVQNLPGVLLNEMDVRKHIDDTVSQMHKDTFRTVYKVEFLDHIPQLPRGLKLQQVLFKLARPDGSEVGHPTPISCL